ncbi:hypothetical protein N0V90_001509 [Kalmusia sp. IMI 367209]|nr:hypothetical protein N0V90_001509 [Kalmusia sp. IMI 367209]
MSYLNYDMNSIAAIALLILYFLALIGPAFAAQRFIVPWDTNKFGPDGPWQAVRITLGGDDKSKFIETQNVTQISAYPGGSWTSITFKKSACTEYPNTLCGVGGTWDPDPDQLDRQHIFYSPSWENKASGFYANDSRIVALGLTIGTTTVWNASLGSCSTGSITYPNGKVGGVPLGILALGAEDTKQTFTIRDTVGSAIFAALFPGQLYKDNAIPSYSYGLHIGSAAFDYPGSLAFGGYNKGRVIGPVVSFQNASTVDLLDIGIGVEAGASPFPFDKKDKLLSPGQSKVNPDPTAPYLSLPGETCDDLAKILPVTYDQSLKYYLWNVDDPLFTKIVSSPAYLSFTFPPGPGGSDNVIIKVPFALLNLTLERPITDIPKQYFPCVPYGDSPVLGRAFLQAAFLGRNWNAKTSWLAQAPGPGTARVGLGDQYTDISDGETLIEGYKGSDYFNQSWSGHWSIIQDYGTNETQQDKPNNNPHNPPSKGLSKAAKAGISVGAALGATLLLGVLAFYWRNRAARKKARVQELETRSQAVPYDQNGPPNYYPSQGKAYFNASSPRYELPDMGAQTVEIPDTSTSGARHLQ